MKNELYTIETNQNNIMDLNSIVAKMDADIKAKQMALSYNRFNIRFSYNDLNMIEVIKEKRNITGTSAIKEAVIFYYEYLTKK